MKELFFKVIKDLFTGIDGESYHLAKVSWAISIFFYMGVVIYKLHTNQPILITDVATGFTIICAGHSAAIYGMAKQEPGEKK